jgi:hypothetical protein
MVDLKKSDQEYIQAKKKDTQRDINHLTPRPIGKKGI